MARIVSLDFLAILKVFGLDAAAAAAAGTILDSGLAPSPHAQGVDFPWTFGLAYESPQGDWFHARSFWCLIGVAVRDGEPILCEVGATPLGVLFRVVCSFCV